VVKARKPCETGFRCRFGVHDPVIELACGPVRLEDIVGDVGRWLKPLGVLLAR
jgi:hypothetical protein